MSALPSKADMCGATRDVRFGPEADILSSLREHRRRHGKAKCFGSFEVDHQLELGRRLDRKIGWLFTPEDAVHVVCRSAILVEEIRTAGLFSAIAMSARFASDYPVR